MFRPTRRIALDRRVCVVRDGRIDIRPERGAVVGPFIGLAISVGLFVAVVLLAERLPAPALVAMLVPGLILGPLSGMGFVYSLFGAHVVIDAGKQSAAFQQGILGLGLGTVELVPFWKVERLEVRDLDMGEVKPTGPAPPLDLRGWDIVMVKVSGKELSLGQVVAANTADLIDEGFNRTLDAAEAVAALVGKEMTITAAVEETAEEEQAQPAEGGARQPAEGSPGPREQRA